MDDATLFAELYPRLRRFAAVVSSPDTDPDDLLQEVVARVLRRGRLVDLEDAASYLRRAVLNLARNEHRNRTTRTAILARHPAPGSRADHYPSDLHDLSGLTAEQRAVLFLRFVEGWSVGDVAEALGLTAEAVRARTARALRALRIEMEREDAD